MILSVIFSGFGVEVGPRGSCVGVGSICFDLSGGSCFDSSGLLHPMKVLNKHMVLRINRDVLQKGFKD